MQHALMGGFGVGPFAVGGLVQWGERQTALLRPYVERWIEQVPRFSAQRSSEEAESFTEFLYPRQLVEPATLAAADRSLAALRDSADISEFDPALRLPADRRGTGRDREGDGPRRGPATSAGSASPLISPAPALLLASLIRTVSVALGASVAQTETDGASAARDTSYPQGSSAGISGELTRP